MNATVGRIVHYYSPAPEGSTHVGSPRAAIVTQVEPDGSVMLELFGPTRWETERFAQARHSEQPAAGCWSWPPRA